MKLNIKGIALLTLFSVPGFAGEAAARKLPFYRPHSSSRVTAAKPRATSLPNIFNAASFLTGASPGGLATIIGDNLTTVSGVVLAGVNPLPADLAGVEVFIGGFAAPIYGIAYVGNNQDYIDVQVPYEAPVGLGAAEVQVYDLDPTSGVKTLVADFFADSFTEDPGIFLWDGGNSANGQIYAIAEASDYSLIGPDNPAIAGEPLVLYVTGLGPLDIALVDGYGSPSSPPFATTIDPFQVIVNGEQCNVFFSGLAPGFVGLYQINFYVPMDAPSGNLQISIQSTYANSGIATLPVR